MVFSSEYPEQYRLNVVQLSLVFYVQLEYLKFLLVFGVMHSKRLPFVKFVHPDNNDKINKNLCGISIFAELLFGLFYPFHNTSID